MSTAEGNSKCNQDFLKEVNDLRSSLRGQVRSYDAYNSVTRYSNNYYPHLRTHTHPWIEYNIRLSWWKAGP